MFRKLAATVAVSTALISPSALSLGLGDIDADSGLNQPLKAEITLLSSRNVSEEDLRAKLASYEAYNKFGVQREAYHNMLTFEIITKNDGTKAIVVESSDPIKEPFVNFLVELNWAQGRLMREYTLLLDPPVFAKTTPTVQSEVVETTPRQTTTPTEWSRPSEPETVSQPTEPTTTQPEINQQPSQVTSTPEFNADSWTVERGETLWSIASSVRPEGVSVQQTLLAIFRKNPEAFINNDMHRMKAGVELSIPDSGAIRDVSRAAAIEAIRNSTPITGPSLSSSSSVDDEAPLDVRKSVDETEIEESEGASGRLSIGSVDEGSSQESGGSTLEDDMSEDLAAADGGAEDNLGSDSGDTASDFDSALSESDVAGEDGLAVEDETLSVLSGSADATEETDEVLVDESADEFADGSEDEVASATNDTDAADKAEGEPASEAANSLQQNSDKAFYEAENFWLYTGGGLLALLLIGGGLLYRRNSRIDEDEGGLLDMMTASNEAKPKKKRESFIDDGGMKAPKEKADPLSQADIFIARGKLSDAENVLEDALAAKPNNQKLRVKLMEVVASQQNIEKFQQLKAELPADFDHDSSLGLKVASLSGLVEPNESEVQMGGNQPDELDFPSEDDIFGDDESKEPVDLDLSEQLESSGADSIESVGDYGDDELGLEDFDKQVKESAKTEAEQDDNAIDFTTEQDDEALVTEEDTSSTNDVADTASSDAAGAGLSADDAATKFDLAKAYMELGDDEAAKDILEEVRAEGNSEQREEADKLLSQM